MVFVGDLVAKGPDSAGVVRTARELGALAVLGNHDAGVLRLHRALTLGLPLERIRADHQQVVDTLTAEDWQYLQGLPLWLELPELNALVVHGGLVPGRALQDQREGDLLTMRVLTPEGLGSKRHSDGELWGRHWPGPAHVYFGHDATMGLQQHEHATGLDTGCVYGRRLTGCLLPEGRLISVPAHEVYLEADE